MIKLINFVLIALKTYLVLVYLSYLCIDYYGLLIGLLWRFLVLHGAQAFSSLHFRIKGHPDQDHQRFAKSDSNPLKIINSN